ncbi:MAG: sel1 repeat family protein [Firmicutes bacterium]|nr:sel1 repeat family protein [Bacillota bacterium]
MGLLSRMKNREIGKHRARLAQLSPEERKAEGEKLYQYGLEYLHPEDGKPDYRAAVKNLRLAAEDGHPGAARKLGRLYQDGNGVAQNDAKAAEWYKKAMAGGDVPAANLLGTLYDLGKGVLQDSLESVRLYHLAAKKGSMKAVNNLGYMYEHGRGLPQDAAKAKRLYTLAAEAGVQRAVQHMGEVYEYGLAGDGKDINLAEALKWYDRCESKASYTALEKRILEGEDIAMIREIGMKFASGTDLPKDYSRAVKFLRTAVDRGDLSLAPLLAAFFETGKGVEKDHYEAYRWYNAANREKDAVDVLEKAMTECDADDLYYIGLKLFGSAGTEEILHESYRFLKAAAELGSAGAAEMIRSTAPLAALNDAGSEDEAEAPPAAMEEAGSEIEAVAAETETDDNITENAGAGTEA